MLKETEDQPGAAGRKGDWMETFSGRRFYPQDPAAIDICIEDVAHALSNLCRFSGHTRHFYSVAEHSVNCVCYLVWGGETDFQVLRGALLHDASEAYLCDIPRPFKGALGGYAELEAAVMAQVAVAFGLQREFHLGLGDNRMIAVADDALLMTEAAQLLPSGGATWGYRPGEPWMNSAGEVVAMQCLQPEEAEKQFLEAADWLLHPNEGWKRLWNHVRRRM